MRRTITVVLLLTLLAAVALGSCARNSGDDSESAADGGDATAAAGESGAAPADLASGPAVEVPEQAEPVDVARRIIYTSDLRIRVDDPSAAATDAVQVAEDAGGDLDSQREDISDEVRVSVRVPSERFREVLDQLAALGIVLERSVDTEDVTDQVVDLEGRLANARASVERLRALFADAADVNQVVAVESALTQREAEVESLSGQLKVLEDQADRSTLTVVFTREAEPEVDDDIPGFAQGLDTGWVALRNVAAVGVTLLGFALPFLLVAAPLLVVGRWWLRRRGRRPGPGRRGGVPPQGPSPETPAPASS